MVKIRTIKPEIWGSEKLGRLSVLARLNFFGLISLADDEGRGRGGIRFLIGHLHPYAEDRVTEQDFRSALMELEAEKLVAFYAAEGCAYYALPGWREHQYIKDPTPSALPVVPAEHIMFPSFNPALIPPESRINPPGREGKGKEGKGLTTAPSAVDQSIKELADRYDARLLDLDDEKLPFGFGETPDRFEKGFPIHELPVQTCDAILRMMPRISARTAAALKARIAQKKADMTPAQRRS